MSRLPLTSIDSEHTIMHSTQIGEASKVVMHDKYTVSYSADLYCAMTLNTLLCIVLTQIGEVSKVTACDKYTISYSTVKKSKPPSAFCELARSVFTACSPRTVNVHVQATPPKCHPLEDCVHAACAGK